MTTEDVNNKMLDYTAAASAAITDWADTRVRGYLKEHPDLVEHGVALLEGMLAELRTQIASERAAGKWGPLGKEPARIEFEDRANEYAAHTCDCGWCLRCT